MTIVQNKLLYIGTNEEIAKLAPVKGLQPPTYLTDTHPWVFCKKACSSSEKWGIISIKLESLSLDSLVALPKYKKSQWKKSLADKGVCLYNGIITPKMIEKIMIYNPNGSHTNQIINKLIEEPIDALKPIQYKSFVNKALGIIKWFHGEPIKYEDMYGGSIDMKLFSEMDDKLNNRNALDLYYIKAEEKWRKKTSSVLKELEY